MSDTVRPAQNTGATTTSDAELVVRAQTGDCNAFEELVRRHKQKVQRLALYLCHGHAEDSEETSQNALLNAYRHLGDFRGESQFSTWLTRIVINECRMYQRRQRNMPRGPSLNDELGEEENISVELVDGSDDPEEQYNREEFQTILRRCLAGMKDIYRIPFILSKIEGLSNQEIASRLGLAIPAAKSRVLRARRWLQHCLSRRFCPPGHCYWPGAGLSKSSRLRERMMKKDVRRQINCLVDACRRRHSAVSPAIPPARVVVGARW